MLMMWRAFFMKIFLLLLGAVVCLTNGTSKHNLKVITIATDETDGYKRFMRSAKHYGLDVEVFGMHEKWLGADLQNGPGGGHKINIIRSNIKKYKNEKNLLIMVTDSYDVIFNGGQRDIIKKYEELNATVLYSAEKFCLPDQSLTNKYPGSDGYRFLCSGGFIGPANLLYEILTLRTVSNSDDGQLYHTNVYLEKRNKYNMKLDHRAELFQTLHGNEDHVRLNLDNGGAIVENTLFHTNPIVIHGNGASKIYLNYFGNYIAKSWSIEEGCMSCKEETISLDGVKPDDLPQVLIGLYIPRPTPFVADYLDHVFNLDYPKDKLDIYMHSTNQYHDREVNLWVEKAENHYRSVTYKSPKSFLTEDESRDLALYHCKIINCQYYFSVDSEVSLTNKNTLKLLIEQNRTILAPKLTRHGMFWSNFWGAIQADGFYDRSEDYLELVGNGRIGVWNVPYISSVYLIRRSSLEKMIHNPFFSSTMEQDMIFTHNNRKAGFFMYVTNLEYFGHLKNTDNYKTAQKNNDLYQIFTNIVDWEHRYLHPEYINYLHGEKVANQPCPDVYWFPFVTKQFTTEIIEECENYGNWSAGTPKDVRLSEGYENMTTVHINQIDFENQWLHMLKEYVKPMATNIYHGYYSQCEAHVNFVVKYASGDDHKKPRPHHDQSTFTINMALNTRGIDYQGGGVRFNRYNCSIEHAQPGWAVIHPGRLTHQHEDLPTTKGTKYNMVSFIDP